MTGQHKPPLDLRPSFIERGLPGGTLRFPLIAAGADSVGGVKNTRADEPCGSSAPATHTLWAYGRLGQGDGSRKSVLRAQFLSPVGVLNFDRDPNIVRRSF